MQNEDLRYLIVDIDGTLSDSNHRLKYIYPPEGEKKNWGKFFSEAKNDEPIEFILEIVRMYWLQDVKINLVTGRPEEMRGATLDWMEKHDIRFDELYMRPQGDHRQDTVVKREIYHKHLEPSGLKVVGALEDRLHVAEMWRELGIPVLLCNDEWRGKKTFE